MSNLPELRLGLAFSLLMQTMPILLVRLGVMLLFWLAALIYLAIAGGVAFLIGQAIEVVGWILFIVAIISIAPLYSLAYKYVFYMIKAAHVAVMAELLANDKLPAGVNQLQWGREKVQSRFGEMNAMFVIDELVSGVVHAFTGTVYNVMSWLPGDMSNIVGILNRIIDYGMNSIDEAVLARSFWNPEQNVWENARDGVILYAMSWKPILMAAVALMVISFIPAVVAFIVFSAPIALILGVINPQLAGWSLIFMLLFAWVIKVAIGDAFAMAAILATYQRETAGKNPDPNMSAQLNGLSEQFRDLVQRAQTGMGMKPKTTSTSTEPASTSS